MNKLIAKHAFALKWIGFAFVIKGILFALTAILFYQNWPHHLITNYFFISSGDTPEYYSPVEAFVNRGVYESCCRMPGLLPIYAPLYFLFGAIWGKTLVIFIQFLASTISVYLLAQVASYVFQNKRAFYYTFVLYALSSFVSNWDHYGYADSFGVSFLIYSIYFAVKFKREAKFVYVLTSGLFIIWSVFFRPVHGAFIPVIAFLFLIDFSQLKKSVISCFLFGLPTLLFISIWTFSNYTKYTKIIFLQGPNSECWGALNPVALSINDLIIAWGGDFQPWSVGSEAEWFYTNSPKPLTRSAIGTNYIASTFTYDSLLLLRNDYEAFRRSTSLSKSEKEVLGASIIARANRFTAGYKAEHTFNYFITNKIKILRQLIAPNRLDDFPTPALSNMNIFHKLLKASYFLLFLYVGIVGFFCSLFMFYKKNYFVFLPWAMLFVIVVVFGYVEQRYIAPAYPLLLICTFPLFESLFVAYQSRNKI